MTTNQPTPVIDDAALAEMERVLADSPCATFPMTTEEARVLCATVRAAWAENIRLLDLVRYCRHQLHDEGLITDAELAALVEVGPESARRLESYDALRDQLAQAQDALLDAREGAANMQRERDSETERASRWETRAAELSRDLQDLESRLAQVEKERNELRADLELGEEP